jgi:predicted PurR-regulated permease PerM
MPKLDAPGAAPPPEGPGREGGGETGAHAGTSTDAGVGVVRDERSALGWAALAATATIVWMVMPVGVGILLGTLLAFMVQPLFERLIPRFGVRASALATVVGSMLTLAGLVFGLASLLVTRGTVLARDLIASVGASAEGGGVLQRVEHMTARLGIPPEEVTARARSAAGIVASKAEALGERIVSATTSTLLALFFATLSLHFILRHWRSVAHGAQESFPLRPAYTAKLFAEFRRVGRTTLLGTIVTGVAQGVFATLGYWVTGVREPAFFGAATAIASVVPVVGTMLVWIPAGISLFVGDHPTRGAIELVWGGVLVVGIPDYVIRPRLVGAERESPTLVTFAALFGGVEVFGAKGLILGPVVMAVAIAVLRLYASEARRRRAAAISPPDSPR